MKKLTIFLIILSVSFTALYSKGYDEITNQKNIKIIEVHYISTDEYVLFKNEGNEKVNMKGMLIESGSKGQTYLFDDLILEPDETFRLHSGPDASGLLWTYEYVHNDTTDGVLLTDINGKYVSGFRWGR